MRPRPPLAALIVLASVALAPATARAYEDQLHLALGAGWGFAPTVDQAPDHGPATALTLEVGLGPAWGIQGVLGASVHPPLLGGDTYVLLLGGAEVTYILDVLSWVPRFGLGLDVLPATDGSAWRVDGAVHALLGVDYLASRTWGVGLDVRPYLRFTNVRRDPFVLTVLLRVGALLDL
ncbi:MAG: hypothetical protein ACFCGT_09995 [Sandaracinaceae bacterium]